MKACVLCGVFRRRKSILTGAAVIIVAAGIAGCAFIFDMSPGKPSFTSHEITGHNESFPSIKLFWEWADDADQHVLERKAPDEGTGFLEITWDYIDHYEDHGWNMPEGKLKAGNTYIYRVRGYTDDMPTELGPWSEEYTVKVPPFLPPENLTATLSSSGDLVRVEWDRVDVDEVFYEVWRSEDLDGYYNSFNTCDICMYEDTYIDVGKTYYYKVVARHPRWGETAKSEPVVGEGPSLEAPVMHDASTEVEPLVVRWSPVQDAWEYRVYRAASDPDSDSSYSPQTNFMQAETGSAIYPDGDYVCFNDTTAQQGATYYYKVQCRTYDDAESPLSGSYVSGYTGTAGVTESWTDLGSAGFASVADGDEPVLAADGGNVYLFYPDADDGSLRLKAMSNTGDGSWSSLGYLSDGTVEYGYVSALVTGSDVYAAYPYDDQQGGDPMIFVRTWTGSAWDAVGSTDYVAWWDDQASQDFGAWGDEPSIAMAGSDIILVYTGDSLSMVESLTYAGGNYWVENDNGYWFDNTISSTGQIVRNDSAGGVIVALEHPASFDLRRYNSGTWSGYAAEFAPAGETSFLYLWDFLLDDSVTPYVLYETLDGSGNQLACTVVSWTGSSWTDTGLYAEISPGGGIMDAAMVEHPDGVGFYVATVHRDAEAPDANYFVDLHLYDGTTWSVAAPQIEAATGVDSIDLALDSSDRPVIVYAEGMSGAIHAKGFRP